MRHFATTAINNFGRAQSLIPNLFGQGRGAAGAPRSPWTSCRSDLRRQPGNKISEPTRARHLRSRQLRSSGSPLERQSAERGRSEYIDLLIIRIPSHSALGRQERNGCTKAIGFRPSVWPSRQRQGGAVQTAGFRKAFARGERMAANPIDRISPEIASRTDSSSSTIEISIFATSALLDLVKHYTLSPPSAIASVSSFVVLIP
jgi:hypothetical protein